MGRSLLGLVSWLLLCFLAAGVGARLTTPAIASAWYEALHQPSWAPPRWLFAPVWTFLFAAMAVAAWLVWRRGGFSRAPLALGLFCLQLALNVAWTLIFFALHRPGAAFAEIVCLWLAILATLVAFWKISPPAGVLLIPYLLWVTFASALNLAIWRG